MKSFAAAVIFNEPDALDNAAQFVLEQLNLIDGRGDYVIRSRIGREITIINKSSCATFCTKKENCDIQFCNHRTKQIQAGVEFIDPKVELALMYCANLNDRNCEYRLTTLI